MFDNPIILSDGTDNDSYQYRGSTLDQSTYRVASAPLDQPIEFSVKHTQTGSGVNLLRRSVYRLDKTVENAEGVQGKLSVYTVVSVPVKIADNTTLEKELNKMQDFLDGQVAKIVTSDI
jgi:hypothetical protein